MQSTAKDVNEYLDQLDEDRRAALTELRALIKSEAPEARESIQYGMPGFTLGGKILCGMAAQKRYMAFYLCNPAIVDNHRDKLGKLDCGKGCIRFRKLDQLPIEAIRAMLREAIAELAAGNLPAEP